MMHRHLNPVGMTPPLITIIIAALNNKKTLQHCIDSVARQTYPNKELIVIDGGSTDGTVDLLEANREQIRTWISEPDRGIYNAWNKGLARAQGEWICFLGADDYFWDGRVLEREAAQLETLPSDIRVAYGRIMLLNNEGVTLYPVGAPWEKIKGRFRQIMCIPHPGAMHRRSIFERHGQFDETFRIAGDYELLLRELNEADAFFMPDIITVAMRQGGISSTPANSLRQLREVRRAQRMHGHYLPGRFWLMAAVRVYLRLIIWKLLGERVARKALDWGRRMLGLPPFWTCT
ncbi:glycosyltransferase family 2 protein [Ferrigenium sp. UT5]|uniref:glycosyltransferase family 2 protein n=1 Tax=Ferrigenium sp. UT5 TaxID=3242105 RepID=UPI00354FBC80